jgi:hypothetical protein
MLKDIGEDNQPALPGFDAPQILHAASFLLQPEDWIKPVVVVLPVLHIVVLRITGLLAESQARRGDVL